VHLLNTTTSNSMMQQQKNSRGNYRGNSSQKREVL